MNKRRNRTSKKHTFTIAMALVLMVCFIMLAARIYSNMKNVNDHAAKRDQLSQVTVTPWSEGPQTKVPQSTLEVTIEPSKAPTPAVTETYVISDEGQNDKTENDNSNEQTVPENGKGTDDPESVGMSDALIDEANDSSAGNEQITTKSDSTDENTLEPDALNGLDETTSDTSISEMDHLQSAGSEEIIVETENVTDANEASQYSVDDRENEGETDAEKTEVSEQAEPQAEETTFREGVPLLEVHFLDVDRNDAILIRCGDESVFIDSGAREYGPVCVKYMQNLGVDHLKYYIGTHGHADHVGGAGAILAGIETETVLINHELAIRCMKDIALLPEQDEALDKANYKNVHVGDEYMIGGAKLTCLGPVNLKSVSRWMDSAENDNSLVFRLTYGEISFLLTSDATTPNFYQILKNDPDALKCTVYKNAHHNGVAGAIVLSALQADYIVFQTSTDHPPTENYVKDLRKKGICPIVTSRNNAGTTVFYTDGETLKYDTEHHMGDWSLSVSELTLKKGTKKGFARNLVPKNMMDTLMWSTSDASVAYPDPNYGTVYAVSPGECIITATAFDGSQRTIHVTVN